MSKELIDALNQCVGKINVMSQLQTNDEFHQTNDFLNTVLDVIEKHKKPEFLERIDNLPDVFMLASLVQFKYVQSVSEVNGANFTVSMAGGHYVFGMPDQYNEFMNKYLTWLETRKC